MSIGLRHVDLDDSFTCIVGSNGRATVELSLNPISARSLIKIKLYTDTIGCCTLGYTSQPKMIQSIWRIHGPLAEKDLARRI